MCRSPDWPESECWRIAASFERHCDFGNGREYAAVRTEQIFMRERNLPDMIDPQDAKNAVFSQANHTLAIQTTGQGFTDITHQVSTWLNRIGAVDGLLTLFIAHTSASLTIQENADPDVRSDLKAALEKLAPESRTYRHSAEGPDDMPAHIKSMLTSVSLSIPVLESRSALGIWQGIYVIEHRVQPHRRNVELHFIGVCQTSAVKET